MNAKIQKLEEKIKKLKSELCEIKNFRPGSLTRQVRKKDSKPYGEYCQLSYSFQGKGHTIYVPQEHAPVIKAEVVNFQKFKATLDRLIAASIALSTLRVAIAKNKASR